MGKGRGWHGEPGRHSLAARGIETVKMRQVFEEYRTNRKTSKTSSVYARKWRRLEERLLSIGGQRVVARNEPDLDDILKRGEVWEGLGVRLVEGEPRECHANAAYFFTIWHDTRVVTGYALSKDGIWRQHSWVINVISDSLTETTDPREKYYGFQMTKKESEQFARENPSAGFDTC